MIHFDSWIPDWNRGCSMAFALCVIVAWCYIYSLVMVSYKVKMLLLLQSNQGCKNILKAIEYLGVVVVHMIMKHLINSVILEIKGRNFLRILTQLHFLIRQLRQHDNFQLLKREPSNTLFLVFKMLRRKIYKQESHSEGYEWPKSDEN